MSSIPSRVISVWRSSLAELRSPINGAFVITVMEAPMVQQSIAFLRENETALANAGNTIAAFVHGARYAKSLNQLCYWKSFDDADALFSFQFTEIAEAVQQLEIHLDINFSFSRIDYLADIGAGLEAPLMTFERQAFGMGVAFELEQRSVAAVSLAAGDITLTQRILAAHQHYSTGRTLLAAMDQVSGLIDAGFFQFYLSSESLLGEHRVKDAVKNGSNLYGAKFTRELKQIVEHVYLARHRFFGHSHPKDMRGHVDPERAYAIALQTLVARWLARELLALELQRPLPNREVRFYFPMRGSIGFSGDVNALSEQFALGS